MALPAAITLRYPKRNMPWQRRHPQRVSVDCELTVIWIPQKKEGIDPQGKVSRHSVRSGIDGECTVKGSIP